jgi:hypothetical protein
MSTDAAGWNLREVVSGKALKLAVSGSRVNHTLKVRARAELSVVRPFNPA